jgi:3-phosphoshikimate 1-carboxyvinyltransferase
MQVTIQPSTLTGSIQAPASKSSMQRACAAALLAGGETLIQNPGHSNDDQSALGIIRALGADTEMQKDGSLKVFVNGTGPRATEVNCGESGLGIRMFTPILSLSEKPMLIQGTGSLLTRPMDFFDEVLPQLGVKVESNQGRLPVRLQGPLKPEDITIDGSLSSQFLTGMLMAFSAAAKKPVSIKVNNLKSRPYIDLTLKVMKDFGLALPENRDYSTFYFSGLPSTRPESREYKVEGDWSGGAFLLVAGAVAGEVVIKGLDPESTQADKAVLKGIADSGAKLIVKEDEIRVGPPPQWLRAFEFDATECPDLFPPLVALAAFCHGVTVIRGAHRLTHKESNRALTLQEEFGKMGVPIELGGDLMLVQGTGKVMGSGVHSRHDHRIAMACAVAALKANGSTSIEEAQAIDKSYPDFFDDIKSLGAHIEWEEQMVNTH